MKILHIISSGGMYGAEAVILTISHALAGCSHTSTLGIFSNSSNPNLQLHESAERQHIASSLIPCRGQIDPKVLARIRDLAAGTDADVIHAHGYKADIYVYLALRRAQLPLVSTCHTWYDNDLPLRIYGIADRFVLRSYAAVVAVSEEVKQRLLHSGVSSSKIHLVRNGIDLRPFENAAPSLRADPAFAQSLIVGLVGRLSQEKGVDIFLQAAARVLAVLPSARFVVIGEGPDHDKLNSLIDDLKLRDKVYLLGRRDDMPSIYASFDLMVSSSRQEGLPMAILEGMASRVPVLATSVGAIPTVIQNGITGILIPADNPDLLATKIIELLQDPALRKQLGTAERSRIEAEYSAARMTNDYLAVYQAAIAAQAAASGTPHPPLEGAQ